MAENSAFIFWSCLIAIYRHNILTTSRAAGEENRIFLISDYFSQGGLNTYLASMKRLLVWADSSTSVHLFFPKTKIFARIASRVVGGYSIIDWIPKSRKRLYGAENGLKIDFALFEISS